MFELQGEWSRPEAWTVDVGPSLWTRPEETLVCESPELQHMTVQAGTSPGARRAELQPAHHSQNYILAWAEAPWKGHRV